MSHSVCFWAHFHWCKWPNIENTIWSSGHTASIQCTISISLTYHICHHNGWTTSIIIFFFFIVVDLLSLWNFNCLLLRCGPGQISEHLVIVVHSSLWQSDRWLKFIWKTLSKNLFNLKCATTIQGPMLWSFSILKNRQCQKYYDC